MANVCGILKKNYPNIYKTKTEKILTRGSGRYTSHSSEALDEKE